MKATHKNLFLILALIVFAASTAWIPATNPGGPDGDCEVDTARLAVVELTVLGMDSLTINDVQNKLDETCGVSFNFACWADTMVFIEYDSLLTNNQKLMAVIENMGYKPQVRLEY